MNQKELRRVMGQFATGITVVTTQTVAGERYGFTANSFTSVSLEPPLVLFCLDKSSEGCPLFLESKCFAVNILSAEQDTISNRFASKLTAQERFENIETITAQTGSPILLETMGWFDCQLHAHYDGGDHWIFVGKVLEAHRNEIDKPILYFQGKYHQL